MLQVYRPLPDRVTDLEISCNMGNSNFFFQKIVRYAYYSVLAKGSVFNAELGVHIVTTVLEGVK